MSFIPSTPEAARQTPERVRAEYAATYREMRAAGFTAVGEFHYLGFEEALAALAAAATPSQRSLEGVAVRVDEAGERERLHPAIISPARGA